MEKFQLSSFLSEEWCPLERIRTIVSSLILFTLGATWHLLLTFEKVLQLRLLYLRLFRAPK